MAIKTVKRSECTCERCNYHWTSRLPKPHQCPKCKSVLWNEKPDKKETEKADD